MLYEGVECSWCGKEQLAVKIDVPDKLPMMLCIPCLGEVYEDWKSEKESTTQVSKLIRIK